jgi:predicted NBD/HSP70 family sugar kinase
MSVPARDLRLGRGDERLVGLGGVLRLIRTGQAVTRADLARATGLARSTVAQRVDILIARGLVYEAGDSASTGGRPPTVLAFNRLAGVVLVADLGATHSRLALSDLAGEPLAETAYDMEIAAGPERVLASAQRGFAELLAGTRYGPRDVRGIGVGVPGPVAFATGQPVNPPIMPGWDGFRVPRWFAARYDAAVLVDNDVNIMALGEHWSHVRRSDHMLYVKVATGIGCGIVSDGLIHRGAQGAAGDIGHVRVAGNDDVICRCGNTGCLEAIAGVYALAMRFSEAGLPAAGARDVVRHVQAGTTEAIRMVRGAGRALGEVMAGSVNFFNPAAIVIGGDLAGAHEHLLAGVREVVFERCPPLATRDLRIVPSRLGDRAGIAGAARMVIEQLFAPEIVDRAVHGGSES